MAVEPHWTAYFTLITPFAAVIAAYVAFKFGRIQSDIAKQQAATALLAVTASRNKLKFDLFEQRLELFESIRKYISTSLQIRKFDLNVHSEYMSATSSLRWLVSSAVGEYVDKELRDKLSKFFIAVREMEMEKDELAKNILTVEASRIQIELLEEYKKLIELFSPYLTLEH